MQTPVQVTFRDIPGSPAIEDHCLDEVVKLERYYDRITSCQVAIAAPHRQHQTGNLYEIRVLLRVPGEELVVNRTPAAHDRAEDVYVAIRETFRKVRRVLEDHVRRRRGQTKLHEAAPLGRVVRLVPDDDCGFLETTEGRQVYFHRNSLLQGSFDDLVPGTPVHFVEEQGEKGPQAASVTPVGRQAGV